MKMKKTAVEDVLNKNGTNSNTYISIGIEQQTWKDNEIDNIKISKQALNFPINNRFSGIKIQCNPPLKTLKDASEIANIYIKTVKNNFMQKNPKFKQPL